MKKIFSFVLTCVLIDIIAIPTMAAESILQKGMLETREAQTQLFDSPDTVLVTKAVINTLQDNGFIIQRLEPDLGYIRAKKEVKLKRTLKGRIVGYSLVELLYVATLVITFGTNIDSYLGMYQNGMRIKNEVMPHTVIYDSNVDIQKFGKQTKVRFLVIEKVLENGDGYTTVKSSPRMVKRHYEPELYQEFFNQVSKNLFLEKNL